MLLGEFPFPRRLLLTTSSYVLFSLPGLVPEAFFSMLTFSTRPEAPLRPNLMSVRGVQLFALPSGEKGHPPPLFSPRIHGVSGPSSFFDAPAPRSSPFKQGSLLPLSTPPNLISRRPSLDLHGSEKGALNAFLQVPQALSCGNPPRLDISRKSPLTPTAVFEVDLPPTE